MTAADLAPTVEESLGSRMKWAVKDSWTIVWQEITHLVRQPSTFAWQLGFPIVMVLLFVYGSAARWTSPGKGPEWATPPTPCPACSR
jgi:hypothetical protein